MQRETLTKFVQEHRGHEFSEMLEAMKKYCERAYQSEEKRRRRKELYRQESERWQNQVDYNGNVVLGIDTKTVDVYDAGFSIWILLNSSIPYNKQKEFLFKHPNQWLPFVLNEMKVRRGFKKYINLMPFCRISKVTLNHRNEAQVTFELKESVVNTLQLTYSP
jgi:hypothetical protein